MYQNLKRKKSRHPAAVKSKVAIVPPSEKNVPGLISAAFNGIIMGALSGSRVFTPVSRNAQLNLVMDEIATTRSMAFAQSTVAKVGNLSGALYLIIPEIICQDQRCLVNLSLLVTETGDHLRTVSKDSESQLSAVKMNVENIIKDFEALISKQE